MTPTRETSSENDVLYEFALGYQHPDPQQLDEFVRAHPAYADALTALALELAIEHTAESPSLVNERAEAQTEAVLSRTMSHFQNRLYAIRLAQGPEHTGDTKPRELFGSRSRAQMQALQTTLDISPLFLRRLRDCEILVDTMTPGFIASVAEAMAEPVPAMAQYLSRSSARLSAREFYKADAAPHVGQQLTFEEAVRSSNLTPEQQARLLAL
jgi:hypothetical protein